MSQESRGKCVELLTVLPVVETVTVTAQPPHVKRTRVVVMVGLHVRRATPFAEAANEFSGRHRSVHGVTRTPSSGIELITLASLQIEGFSVGCRPRLLAFGDLVFVPVI